MRHMQPWALFHEPGRVGLTWYIWGTIHTQLSQRHSPFSAAPTLSHNVKSTGLHRAVVINHLRVK